MIVDIGREAVAYGLMAATAAVALPVLIVQARRRRRLKLRRRGIKRYNR